VQDTCPLVQVAPQLAYRSMMVRPDRFPLTYDECRERFRWTVTNAGLRFDAHPITARGLHGQELTIDVTTIGAAHPRRALLVLAGVHGDEGFSSSTLLCDAIDRWAGDGSDPALADDSAIVLIHGVNPWGMSYWRRQNESNVDLNRNWGRDERVELPRNPGYAELHPHLVPGGDRPPTAESLLDVTRALVAERGYAWVKSAVSEGQYTHPDGLYFGGDRTEESNRILADLVGARLAGTDEVLVVDLHTGHGTFGTYTLLSPVAPDHPDDAWVREVFGDDRVECTASPDATTGPKHGQIATGLASVVPGATWRTVTMELGTISDTRMIVNERAEHWVHFHGDRTQPEHARIVWDHRCGSTPDDAEWERSARAHGVAVLDAARTAAVERGPGALHSR
jgi:octopine/nopaline transport system ATP-binding protein